MKKIVSVFLSFLIFLSIIFGFIGCAESVSNDDNTSGVTLNFNGTTLHGKNAKYLNSEDIAPYVGMPIQEALAEMDFGIDSLERNGFYFNGWTKTKNGEDYILHFPTFGTIYAKWVECVRVTFNLNGGYAYDYDGNLQREKITCDIPKDKYLDFFGAIVPIREGYTFIGWSKTKNGTDGISQAKENCPTVYARWQENLKAFDAGDIAGEFAPEGAALTKQEEGVYTYEFIYSEDMNSWGSSKGSVKFKVRTVADDWFVTYGCLNSGFDLIIDNYSTQIIPTHNKNVKDITLSGLEDGITYTIRVECSENGNFTVNAYTGGDVLDLGGDGSLTFTLDTGNAYFKRENKAEGIVEGPKRLIYKFNYGTTLEEIINNIEYNAKSSILELLYTEYNYDLDSSYLYREGDDYYTWNKEFKDSKGNIISLADNTKLDELTLSRNTVYTLLPRKLVTVTFDFNGGKYDYTTSREDVLIEGDSLDSSWMDYIYKSGSVFMGWTTEDGTDATIVPGENTIFFAKWGHTLTINAGTCRFRNIETDEYVNSISYDFISGSNIQDVWNDIFTFVDGKAQFTVENGVFEISKYDEANNIYYESNGMYYGLTGIYDSNSNKLFDENFEVTQSYIQLSSNTNWYFEYDRLYQVTFDLNGGSYNNSTEVVKEYKFQNQKMKSFKPTKEGYKFLGWTQTLDDEDFVEELSIQEDTTVYAKWKDLSICELYLRSGDNGYFGHTNATEIILPFDKGSSLSAVVGYVEPLGNVLDSGKYDFIGYADEDGNMISPNTELTGLTILNAVYEYKRLISVTFDAKGGQFKISEGNLSEQLVIIVDVYEDDNVSYLPGYLDSIPVRDGQEFIGWYDAYTGEQVYTHSSEHTSLIAKWSCVLTIDAGQGTFVRTKDGYTTNQIQYPFNSGISVEQIIDSIFRNEDGHQYFSVDSGEYEFYKDENNIYYSLDGVPYGVKMCSDYTNRGQTIFDSSFNVFNQSSTLESNATWTMEYDRLYTVTCFLTGGSYNGSTENIIKYSLSDFYLSMLTYTPIKEGYKFLGWTQTFNGEVYDGYIFLEEDITVYAKWSEKPLQLYEYSSDNTQITFAFVPSFFGYDWDVSENHEVQLMADVSNWEKNKDYLMTKDSSGNYILTIDYTPDVYLDFKNWPGFKFYVYEDDTFLGPNEHNGGYGTITWIDEDDPNFYLEVVDITTEITFDLNGGNIDGDTSSFTQIISIGDWLDRYSRPEREGYKFVGWTRTRNGDDLVSQVEKEETLYAKWQDSLELFANGDIVGELTLDETGKFEDGHSLKYEGNGIYTYSFTFDSINMVGWDGPDDGIAFKLRPVEKSWAVSYGIPYPDGSHPIVGGGEVLSSTVTGSNIIVGGLKDGNSYIITVRCTEDGDVFVKIDEA